MCKKCSETENSSKNIQQAPKLRKKIWDLEGRFHCSVIGTCLSLKELDKIIRKTGITNKPGATNYDKHCFFVDAVSSPSAISRLISKFLDKKYNRQITAIKRMSHLDEFTSYWQDCINKGDVSGAYWALLTHPESGRELRYLTYGDVHMLSHIEGFAFRKERRQFQFIREQIKNLEQATQREITLRKDISREKTALKSELALALAEITLLKNQLNVAKDNFEILMTEQKNNEKHKQDNNKANALQNRNEILQFLNADLQSRSDSLTGSLLEMEQEKKEVETALNLALAQCQGSDTDLSEKIDLQGKTVIYLGGPRQKQITRFRSVVESGNGQFIHHDGGQEDGDGRLAEILCKGDVIMCPIDCISHQACLKAKKICKFQGKSFVPLRSSGISSFMTELQQISSQDASKKAN